MSSDCSSCSISPGNAFGLDLEGVEPELREVVGEYSLEVVKRFLGRLGDWIFSGGEGKPQGVMIRCHVAFWDVVPALRGLKQVELAELMGLKHKQSVGREVSDFRDRFGVRNGHMHSERAREVCREREAFKKMTNDKGTNGKS